MLQRWNTVTVGTAIAFFILFFLVSCGYQINRIPPVKDVQLGTIKNNTTEPGLQDRLYDALPEALSKRGIRLRSDASYVLEGSLEKIDFSPIMIADDLAQTYEVKINGNFFLRGPDGFSKRIEKLDFIVTFASGGDLTATVANRNAAIKRAISNLASSIAAQASFALSQ